MKDAILKIVEINKSCQDPTMSKVVAEKKKVISGPNKKWQKYGKHGKLLLSFVIYQKHAIR